MYASEYSTSCAFCCGGCCVAVGPSVVRTGPARFVVSRAAGACSSTLISNKCESTCLCTFVTVGCSGSSTLRGAIRGPTSAHWKPLWHNGRRVVLEGLLILWFAGRADFGSVQAPGTPAGGPRI